jgi:hypothetical protein
MAFHESSGFVRPYGRRAIAKLATVIRAAAGFRIKRDSGRRRAPPVSQLRLTSGATSGWIGCERVARALLPPRCGGRRRAWPPLLYPHPYPAHAKDGRR